MQPYTASLTTASPRRRFRPIALIVGAFMLMVLSACQSALADSSSDPRVVVGDAPISGNTPVSSSVTTEASVLNHNEVSLHGDLVWRGGRLWIVTPRGPVRLVLPSLDLFPAAARLPDSATAETDHSLGEYGVIGNWSLVDTGLAINVRELAEWPFRTIALDHCGDGRHRFEINDNELGIHGALVRIDGQLFLKTSSGLVFVHLNGPSDLNAEFLQEGTFATDSDIVRRDVVLIGPWKTDGRELHMEVARAVRIKTVCEPPTPPRQPILPGEISALGHLVFENGRPFLETPQGRIVLLTRDDGTPPAPQPLPGDFFDNDILEDLVPESETPENLRFPRQIIVVGKWFVYRNQLAIQVRYAIPWPYPQPTTTTSESLTPWDFLTGLPAPVEADIAVARSVPGRPGTVVSESPAFTVIN
ncbi:MAG: hypothetical protein O3B95_08315 [Chloroflexi bacterium]|nr:hypothetical protein [Chloroflexota bacterium]